MKAMIGMTLYSLAPAALLAAMAFTVPQPALAAEQIIPRGAALPDGTTKCQVENLMRGSKPGTSLQTLIDVSRPGDTIQVKGLCIVNLIITGKSLSLVGKATSAVPHPTLSGGGLDGVVRAFGSDVTITNLVLTDGGQAGAGGGIWSADGGELTLNGSTSITGNHSLSAGAGVVITSGTMTMNDSSSVSNNHLDLPGSASLRRGGGIFIDGSSTLTLNDKASVSSNSAIQPPVGSGSGDGGGIYSEGTVIMNGASSVTHNLANSTGGVRSHDLNGTATFAMNDASLVGQNTALFDNGGVAVSGVFTMSGSSAVSGNTAGRRAGGIGNLGTVTLNDSAAVTGNVSQDGGGIYNVGLVVLSQSSTVSSNIASGNGGGINNTLGTFVMNGSSSLYGNRAGFGGGVYSGDFRPGSVTMNDVSQILGNTADFGGGIYNDGDTVVTLNDRSSITGNTATEAGGGIFNALGTITLNDSSTITGNIPDDCTGDSPGCP